MYESFYGFREKPFSLIPDPDFLYLSRLHKAALNMLEYGLRGEAGFTLISGEVGSGKTILVRRFLKMVDRDTVVGLITNTHSSIGNLLDWILLAFGLDFRGKDKVELYQIFSEFLADLQEEGRRAILIIDEAQNMGLDTLEELRMLSNINADKNLILQIVLVGQPEILENLNRPEMRQLAQRISVTFRLWPLTFAETCGYVRHRVKVAGGSPAIFDDSACGAIYHFTEGLPRPINILCDAALVYGFGEGKPTIDIDTILDVIEDRQRSGLQPFSRLDKEFDRTELVRTISELVETYGTPELLAEAASLPADESGFVADELEDYEAGDSDEDADTVAPFVDRGPYDLDEDRPLHALEDAADYHDPEQRRAVGEADLYGDGEGEADWRDAAFDRPPKDAQRRGSGWGRWVAIIALVSVGLAVAIWALPFVGGTLKSSELPGTSDLVARLTGQASDEAAGQPAAEAQTAQSAPEGEQPSGAAPAGASSEAVETPEEEAAAASEEAAESAAPPTEPEETAAGPTEAGQPEIPPRPAGEPISVEVFEYGGAPDRVAPGDAREDGQAEAIAASPQEGGDEQIAAAADHPGEGGEDDPAAVPGETPEIALRPSGGPVADDPQPSGSAVERASQDLLRLSGIDSASAVSGDSLAFSSLGGDLRSALDTLFSKWSVDYSSAEGTSPCGKALRQGLRCFEEQGDWNLIGRLNRPALISLDAPDGRQIHGVVSALDDDKVAFVVDGRELLVTLDQLTPYWHGEFLLLWRPPAVYRRLLRQGLRGDDVVWLRNQLAAVNGAAPPTQDAIIFDEALKNEVIAFQREHGLKVDGLVGSETLVHLSSANAQPGDPVLSDRIL